MADLVRSNSSDLLIRKIGYSVGLEDLENRVKGLVELCKKNQTIKKHHFENLVTQEYGRKIESVPHFYNFYSRLQLIRYETSKPVMLHALTALIILRSLVDSTQGFDKGLKAILLAVITLADGELFGNLLRAKFGTKEEIESQLSIFKKEKIDLLAPIIRTEKDRELFEQVIHFRNDKEQGDGQNKSKEGMTVRELIEASKNKTMIDPEEVSLSDDWMRKVPKHRKAWARGLYLFDDEDITDTGTRYLAAMHRLLPNDINEKLSTSVLMPTDLELVINNLQTSLPQQFVCSFSEFTEAIASVYAPANIKTSVFDGLNILEILKEFGALYRAADSRFTILRKEIPFPLYCYVMLGLAASKNMILEDSLGTLEKLANKKENLFLRKSRKSLYSISIKGGF